MRNSPGSSETDGPSGRDDVLGILSETMDVVGDRIDASDPETAKEERLLIQWVRAQGYLAGQYRKLKADIDIDEMEDSLELLEQAQDLRSDR